MFRNSTRIADGVFFLSMAPSAQTFTTLYNFGGATPASVFVLGPNGVLYGTTEYGGANGHGVVFELAPPASPGGSWTETILHSFAGLADRESPNGLALGPDGTLYGTTNLGGRRIMGRYSH